MRILHCLRAPIGGLFRHVLDLAEEQAKRGHDVGLLADSRSEDRLTTEKLDAIAPLLTLGIVRVPMSRQPAIGDVRAAIAVWRHASQLDLDVLHGHGAKGGAYARIASAVLRARGHAVKSFYTPHGGSLNFKPGSLEARILLACERGLEAMTTGLIFESAYAAEIYAERVGEQGAPRRVVPNGLKAQDFSVAEPVADASDLLFIGELRAIKGVDVLLEALAELNAEKPVTATIVGSGPETEHLRGRALALGLDGTAKFTGAMPARQAFNLGRVMVVPSRAESLPYVVLEATAAEIPLVATDVGGIPEIVAGTDTELIEAGNVDALVAALRAVLDRPDVAKARAARLRSRVQSTFTVDAMADAVLDFYAEPSSGTRG